MNAQQISIDRQCKLLREVAQCVVVRRQAEAEINERFQSRDTDQKGRYEAQREQMSESYDRERTTVNDEYMELLAEARREYEAQLNALVKDERSLAHQADRQKNESRKNAEWKWRNARQNAIHVFRVLTHEKKNELQEFLETCDNHHYELQMLDQHLELVLRRRRCLSLIRRQRSEAVEAPSADVYQRFQATKDSMIERFQALDDQTAARFFDPGWIFLYFLFGFASSAFAVGHLWSWAHWYWAAAGTGCGVVVCSVLTLSIYRVVRRQTQEIATQILQDRDRTEAGLAAAREAARSAATTRYDELVQQRDVELKRAEEDKDLVFQELANQHQTRIEETARSIQARRQSIEAAWERRVRPSKETYPPLLERLKQDHHEQQERLRSHHEEQLRLIHEEHQRSWDKMAEEWNSGITAFQTAVQEMNDYRDRRFPNWERIDWSDWKPSSDPVPLIPFGNFEFELNMFEGGVPTDSRLAIPQTQFSLPAVLSFPDRPSLLLETFDEGRPLAVRSLQNIMLRLLTALPPGKVRFTVIDPTGLGENFSAFMHLADFDERLVSNRIWTETNHINQRLTDLTEHMENVIQKYLRNQFESIQEYNENAGEVAEPFQILVVANFPANFSEEAARRLVSIASSGARCGVHTLVSCDTKMNVPRNFDLADLRAHATTLEWCEENCFRWQDDELARLTLTLDQPPVNECFTNAVRSVGQHAKNASRVEVPFACVVSDAEHWWRMDSRCGIDVALGRAGATKLQHLQLGEGTSQHVLIAGKTGAGKSTLLHALITNTAIHYSPDEVHFYLIDFKKGVEFKPYATFGLPHARVIAIESEREFGMSVLEHLDLELQRRGDVLRGAGVQDIEGFRNAHNDKRMPRILLIIDEFQELFVKDDKIAQDAGLLLDRLVRQGRAFGIHVLLGSQTLAGAYSLARSTVGQMAVRIALQCSEADAHLILSEDNTAARLLNRPGEAIYNNANGTLEGNHPFQVVWLPDPEREQYLRQIADLSRERKMHSDRAIVFEGNIPADAAQNTALQQALKQTQTATQQAPRAWLGASVAIKDPTSVAFRRQSGANLLVVGQQEESASGLLVAGLVGLAAHVFGADRFDETNGVKFFVLNGARPESPESQLWQHLLPQFSPNLQIVSPREVETAIAEIAALVDQRLQADDDGAPPVFLLVHDLARFRALRKTDDDFGFSSQGQDTKASAATQFHTILREGPVFGVHSLIWCDTYTNVSRWLDRQTMRDLEMRVLFQLSASDSSNLMDSPAASQLGVHRAILYSEEDGRYEKFRPYGVPSPKWLERVGQQLLDRSMAQSE